MTKEISACALALLGLVGCASKPAVMPEPTPTPAVEASAPIPSATPSPQKAPLRHVIVAKGDSLWALAGRDSVLGDAFHWPLLYRHNRDELRDPDLIEPGQDLAYPAQVSEAEALESARLARLTPPFQPHSALRQSLPLKY